MRYRLPCGNGKALIEKAIGNIERIAGSPPTIVFDFSHIARKRLQPEASLGVYAHVRARYIAEKQDPETPRKRCRAG
jgi:hypothetical protein